MRVVAVGIVGVAVAVAVAEVRNREAVAASTEPVSAAAPRPDWGAWTRPLAPGAARSPVASSGDAGSSTYEEIDVVDARWMAMTMWGEGRGGGEAAMRAVGHVIDNRTHAGLQSRYVTDTVSEAFQFSCWNPSDPNREAMLNVESLRPGSVDHHMWLVAKRLAEEILAGRSTDPTGGALFYHTEAVAPRWSRGIAPVRQIGTHLFFRIAR